MKMGKLEGSPEEIYRFYQINDLNVLEYIDKPETQLKRRWVVVPAIISVILLIILALDIFPISLVKASILAIGIACSVWLACSIHVYFKNRAPFLAVVFVLVLIFIFFSGLLPIKDILEIIGALSK